MKTLKKLVGIPLSVLFYIFFFLTLLIFHPAQWLCLKIGGYKAHKKCVDIFNFMLLRCLNILGTTFTFENRELVPYGRPVIFVANHQGMFDIPPFFWYLRKHHPKFVSKKELGRGIPSISFNLRHGGSILIDRKNPRQSLTELNKFSRYLNETKRSGVIFPEGTRSRTGKPKKFAVQGLQLLIKKMPEALIVPVTINNSWKLFRYGNFPMGVGAHLKFTIHQPIPADSDTPENIVALVEKIVISDIED